MYIYHHFYLKATNCPKGTVDSTGCQFRNDRVSYVWFIELLFAELVKKKSGIWKGEEPALTHVFFLFVCVHAAADRLHSLLQNVQRPDRTGAQTVRSLCPQNGPHAGQSARCCDKHSQQTWNTLHQIVSDFFFRFTFTSFSWTTGDEDDQSGALQPGGLQQWIPNPPGINRNRVIPRVTRVESNVTPISVSLSCFGAASISTSS